jgi:trimethylamine corrinoid protein
MANEELIQEAREALLATDKAKAEDVANRALAAGMEPSDIMQNGFVVGIRELGEKFDRGEVFLPELMLAAEAMQAAMEICNAALPEGKTETRGVIVLGTVEGDVHDIGKAIVAAYLRANGYDVYDIGKDVPPQDFIDKAVEVNADVIGSSALLTATLAVQEEIEEYLKDAGLRDKFKTIVGGATCTEGWAEKIGADAYAKDASDAILKIEKLVGR